MKILHVGLCVDGKNEGLPYALNKASDIYAEMKPEPRKVLKMVGEVPVDFDLAFFQIQAPNVIEKQVFQILKERGVFTVNWCGDIRKGTPDWYYHTGADLTLFTNLRDVENMRGRGLNADFLQIGIDPEVFRVHGIDRRKRDFVFMGNDYGNQFPLGGERRHIASQMVRHGGTVIGGYRNAEMSLNGNQFEEAVVYNNSKIGINHSHFLERRYTSDRMFRIMGSGAMCLSHYYPEMERDFIIGEHLDVYHDGREMLDKVRYYLEHEEERAEIALAGMKLVHKEFTYANMVSRLIELYKKYK